MPFRLSRLLPPYHPDAIDFIEGQLIMDHQLVVTTDHGSLLQVLPDARRFLNELPRKLRLIQIL